MSDPDEAARDLAAVRALLKTGADPAGGFPSAIETARMFGRTEVLQLFEA